MRTVMLELPEDLADRLESLPEGERNNYAVALMRQGLAIQEEEESEILAALQESKAQADAGQLLTLEDLDDRIERLNYRLSMGGQLRPGTRG